MIEPRRAPVRPRVVCPDSGEELPLEDVVLSYLEAGANRTLRLHGDASAVQAALCHLAFVFRGRVEVSPRVSPGPNVLVRGGKGGHLIVDYRLAPWGRDDWMEYLLNVRPDRCASVMRRLPQPAESDPLEQRPGPVAAGGLRRVVRPVGERHHDVLQGGQPRQQVEVLEH